MVQLRALLSLTIKVLLCEQPSKITKNKVSNINHIGDDYAKYISLLALKAKSMVRDLDPLSDLSFLRIKTRNEEIMVTPDKDFMLIAIQGPKAYRDKKDDDN